MPANLAVFIRQSFVILACRLPFAVCFGLGLGFGFAARIMTLRDRKQ